MNKSKTLNYVIKETLSGIAYHISMFTIGIVLSLNAFFFFGTLGRTLNTSNDYYLFSFLLFGGFAINIISMWIFVFCNNCILRSLND